MGVPDEFRAISSFTTLNQSMSAPIENSQSKGKSRRFKKAIEQPNLKGSWQNGVCGRRKLFNFGDIKKVFKKGKRKSELPGLTDFHAKLSSY